MNTQSKDGKAYKDKNGSPACRVVAQFEAYGDEYFSCFAKPGEPLTNVKPGDSIEAVLFEKDGFKNFRLPSKSDGIEARLEDLEARVKKLEKPDYRSMVPASAKVAPLEEPPF